MTQHIGQSVYRAALVAATDVATFLSPVPGNLIEVAVKLKGGVNPNGVTNFRVRIEGVDVGTVSIPANSAQGILTLTSPAARFAEVKIEATLVPVGGLAAPIYVFATFEDSQGLIKRSTVVFVSPALLTGATSSTSIQLGRAFAAYRLQTSVAARVRLYTKAVYRDADAARPLGTPPEGEHGLILEEETTADNLTLDFSNARIGANLEAIVTDDIPALVTNLSGGTTPVTVSITRAVIEGAGAGGSFLLAVEDEEGETSVEVNRIVVAEGDVELLDPSTARIRTAGDAQLTVVDTADVPVEIVARRMVVAAGDLEELEDGSARIRTASDVVLPTGAIEVREVDNPPTLANILRLVVSNGDLEDLGDGEARLHTASTAVAFILSLLGVEDGIAALNGAGKILLSQLPLAAGDVSGALNALFVNQIKGRSLGGIPSVGGFLVDSFTGGVPDTSVWQTTGQATQHDGALYLNNGGVVISNIGTPNFTDRYFSCRVHPTGQLVVRLAWGDLGSGNEYAQIWFRPGMSDIRYGYRTTPLSSVWLAEISPYVEADHAYIKIQHSTATGKVHFYRSVDGVVWIEVGNVATPVSIAAVYLQFIDLGGGGNAWIDDFDSNLPTLDAITGRDHFVLGWDNPNTQFSLFRGLGIIPYVSAGAPLVGEPSNLPAGYTLGYYEGGATRKHHIWNRDTGVWDEQGY